MPLSYRNIIDGTELKNSLASGNFKNDSGDISFLKKPITNNVKYIKGYANQSALEGLASTLNINKGLFKQMFGLEDKKLDAYDPYHTSDAKKEEFWLTGQYTYDGTNYELKSDTITNLDGKSVQKIVDEDTSAFKRSLFSQLGYGDTDFFYEDPFVPEFELYFKTDSPFFSDNISSKNSLLYFINNYGEIDPTGYGSRLDLWNEFKNVFFKIFQSEIKNDVGRNLKNKAYYITKLEGINLLNKKIIKYGGTDSDKITITLNEDISMIAWYIAELYNNLVYSYKNQRFMFPENLLRFDLMIKINDVRNFVIPVKDKKTSKIMNEISKKSQIVYTLHDCNFDFFESKNYGDSIEIGGYGGGPNITPQTLSFNIFFKSVTRWSEFPLQNPLKNSKFYKPGSIDGWEQKLSHVDTIEEKYSENLNRSKEISTTKGSNYANDLLGAATQTVVNQGLNYMDSLESKLREVRGSVVNNALQQLNNASGINKIEPDNVYSPDFNNRISLSNFGKQLASGLLTDLTNSARDAANF
jgi:hypothetical protein